MQNDDGSNNGSVEIFNVYNGFWNIPLNTLESLANLEPVPKSAHYYAGLAWIMMEAQEETYTNRAIECFNNALELLPGGWMAMEGLARCYGENRGEYETAIHWMEDAILNLPQTVGLAETDFYLETRISDWKLQLGDDQESVGIAQTSYEASKNFLYGNGSASDSSILRSIKHYIEALYRTSQYDQITELLHDLDRRETLELRTSLWTIFLREQIDEYFAVDLFNKLGKVAQESKDDSIQKFMRVSITKAIKLNADTIVDHRPIWLADQLAQWQYRYALDPQESIQLWDEIVTLVDQSNDNVQQSQNWFRLKAASYLSLILFNTAKTKFKAGKDTSIEIAKIGDLAKHKQGSKRYYRASYPAQVLGLWIHEYSKGREEDWRACIRPSIKQALYLLSDEDPWNDQDAYSQLGQALFAAGDVLNGSIAYGMTLKPLESHSKELKQGANEDVQEYYASQEEATPGGAQAVKQQDKGKEENISKQQITDAHNSQSFGDKLEEVEESTIFSAEEGDETGEKQAAAPDENGDKGNDDQNHEKQVDEGDGDEDDDNDDDDNHDNDASAESFNPKYAGFGYMWECDGPCSTPISDYAELWRCRVCVDSCFCESCIELHRRDEIPARICAVDHPLVRVYPLTNEARELTNALVGKRFEAQQEWLDDLQKAWED